MRKVLLALAAGAFALPVAAQTEGSSDTEGSEAPQTAAELAAGGLGCETAATNTTSMAEPAATATGAGDALQSALTEAGFRDLQVLRTGYIVQAVSPDQHCMMIIVEAGDAEPGLAAGGAGTSEPPAAAGDEDEPSLAEGEDAEEEMASEEAETAPAAGQVTMGAEVATSGFAVDGQQIIGDLMDAGYTDVRILDSAFALTGRTPNGQSFAIAVKDSQMAE